MELNLNNLLNYNLWLTIIHNIYRKSTVEFLHKVKEVGMQKSKQDHELHE
jgi:hypothetical protein